MSRDPDRSSESGSGNSSRRDDGRGHGVFKQFWLILFVVDYLTSVLVFMLIIIIVGFIFYVIVLKEVVLEIIVFFIVVNTVYFGVVFEDIESLIIRELEDELNKIGDVEEIMSTSVEGYFSIVVEFVVGMDMIEVLQLMCEKVDIAKSDLLLVVEESMIVEFNFAEFPIMQVNISGEYGLVCLKRLAEDV